MDKKTIAIIEDEESLSKILNNTFSDVGFNVVVAKNGEDGLKLVESEKIDLILLDILLPRMNGIEFLKKLRENDKYKNIKIIILSVANEMEKIASAMEGGVYIYLMKDQTKMDDLVKIVKEKLSV